jgi:CheY-like chemotaxis protein
MSDSFNAPLSDENRFIDITAEMAAGPHKPQEEPTDQPEGEDTNHAASSPEPELELAVGPFSPYSLEDLFPEDGCEGQGSQQPGGAEQQEAARAPVERRRRRRALISAPIRVRGVDLTNGGPDEVSTTIDVSRLGILFETSNPAYFHGMDVAVTFPYVKTPGAMQTEQKGLVVRVRELSDGRRTVAVALGVGTGTDLIDASGRNLSGANAYSTYSGGSEHKKPLVLVLDSDASVRESLKTCLGSDGYEVIALSNGPDAREVLKMFTPALVIAEIEGDGLPGYDICALVKAEQKLKHIPVVLTTSSGYPSDYANAHALGAIVCMAKPYKQERLSHVVRLLAPTAQAKEQTAPARAADPSRKPGASSKNGKNGKNGQGANGSISSSLFRIIGIM